MADDVVTQMVQDPQFQQLPIGEMRKALSAHDPMFQNADDNAITGFVQAHQQSAQTNAYHPMGVSGGKPTDLPGASQQLKKFAVGIPVGAVKSLAQVQENSPVGTLAAGMPSAPAGQAPGVQQRLQLQGAGEHVGAGLEQAGEMALTGGPIRQGAEALLTKLPFLGKFMGPGARVAGEAVNTAANAQMHGQDPNSAAVVGSLGAGAAESLPFLSSILKKGAVSQYTKALAPTKEANKYAAQKVVPGLLERGVVGSPTSIAQKASQNAGVAGGAVQSAENAIPVTATSDVTPVLQKLDQIKAKYSVGGTVPESRQSTADYIDSLKNDVLNRSQNGQMRTQDLIQFRRLLDQPVAQASGYAGKTMIGNKSIDKAAANSMREILNSSNPDLAEANKSYNFWQNVRQVSSATAQRQTGQQGALKTVMTGIGLAGGFSRYGAEGAAVGAGGMYVLTHLVQSPQWRTASAVLKNRIADAIATNNSAALVRAVGDFSAASASQLSGQPVPQSDNKLPSGLDFLRQLTGRNQ